MHRDRCAAVTGHRHRLCRWPQVDSKPHVEWYETRHGVTWLPERVSQRLDKGVRAVVVDERNPAAELDWWRPVSAPPCWGRREVAVAAGAFVDAVTDRHLHQRGQVELSRGVLGAKQRPLLGGQAFGWDRKAAGSSALIAASLALWGVDADRPLRPRRRPPGSRPRVVVLT